MPEQIIIPSGQIRPDVDAYMGLLTLSYTFVSHKYPPFFIDGVDGVRRRLTL
jgi:hypothetical protein